MPGSSTPPGQPSARDNALGCVAFRFRNRSAPGNSDFVAQWLACALLYQRFVDALTDGNARLGADVDRFSFIVSDFHRLLLAGLLAHFESDVASYTVRCPAAWIPIVGEAPAA
jgi:hypothetical protein